jgi:chromosome segregation ATPase
MKKSILITVLALVGLIGFGFSAHGDNRRDRRDDRREYDERYSDYRQLRAELIQLNIMFSRVESQFRLYGIGRQTRWDYTRLLRERDRLEYALQRRPLNRLYIHSQIDRIREDLRELEVRMRVRPHRFYRR